MIIIIEIPILLILLVFLALVGQEVGGTLRVFFGLMSFFSVVMVAVSAGLAVRDYKEKTYSGVAASIISAIVSLVMVFYNLNVFSHVQGRVFAYQIFDVLF